MAKLKRAATLAATATLFAGALVGLSTGPAAAACDTISIAKPAKSGDNVRANSSICAATNWFGRSYIERDRGVWWQEVDGGSIWGQGINVTKQYPRSWNCAGAGTYTYRGKIWITNNITRDDETSASNRFRC